MPIVNTFFHDLTFWKEILPGNAQDLRKIKTAAKWQLFLFGGDKRDTPVGRAARLLALRSEVRIAAQCRSIHRIPIKNKNDGDCRRFVFGGDKRDTPVGRAARLLALRSDPRIAAQCQSLRRTSAK